MSNSIRFFTYSQFHGKRPPVGSTQIRVNQLIKYWPEAGLYKYGEFPDVLIFQKVYCTQDYKFPAEFENIKILDICDPDWREFANVRETVDAVDAVVCSSKHLKDFIKQFTNKPVVVIKDRFDLDIIPTPKNHSGELKKAVWFGYAHNAELLSTAVPYFEKVGIELTVISNEDPCAWRWANDQEAFKEKYTFKKYQEETIYQLLQEHDVCVLPKGNRPQDYFKSENKAIKAQLAGLPVVTNDVEFEAMKSAKARNDHIASVYDTIREEYDVRKSVEDYKSLIAKIRENARNE